MSKLFRLTAAQMARLRPFVPMSHGRLRADRRDTRLRAVSDDVGRATLQGGPPTAD